MDEISAAKLITYFIKKYIKEKKEVVFKINTRATYQLWRRRLHLKKAFEQVKNLFENIDSKEYYRFMNAVHKRLPKSNMHKHYRSMLLDLGLAKIMGSKYVGDFLHGKKHGNGTYTRRDGSRFAGEWKNDMAWNGVEYDPKLKIVRKARDGRFFHIKD